MKLRYVCRKNQAWWKTMVTILAYLATSLVLGRKGRALVSFFWYTRLLDHLLDGDQVPATLSRYEYFSHRKRLLERLTVRQVVADDLLDEDWLLIHTIVYERKNGKDSIPEIVAMGNAFLTDASRHCNNQQFPSVEQLYSTREAIRLFLVFSLNLAGSHRDTAHVFASLFEPFLFEADNLVDFLNDVKARLINEPREHLERAGIDTVYLMKCSSWEELKVVPGFSSWYESRVRICQTAWESAKPQVSHTLKDCVTSRLLRKSFERLVGKVDRWLDDCSLRLSM